MEGSERYITKPKNSLKGEEEIYKKGSAKLYGNENSRDKLEREDERLLLENFAYWVKNLNAPSETRVLAKSMIRKIVERMIESGDPSKLRELEETIKKLGIDEVVGDIINAYIQKRKEEK
jgi:aldehyde:ferredoxin oxidoreductase